MTHCSQLGHMTKEMTTCFKNLSDLIILNWLINSFLTNSLPTDLIDLQNDCEAEVLFRKKDFKLF